jgi:PLP dependent protein
MTSHIAHNLEVVRHQVTAACQAANRNPDEVTLVAVSKRHPLEALVAAYEAGQMDFAENYAQEFAAKREQLLADYPNMQIHYIGPLQSNKVKLVAGRTSLLHTVDRAKILKAVNRIASAADTVQDILFEVHLSPEDSKAGCSPEQLPALLEMALQLPTIRPRGLMTMPPWDLDPEDARPYFAKLRSLQQHLRDTFTLPEFDQLSMGMSHDFPIAIAEGATIVRVGTAIFGARS